MQRILTLITLTAILFLNVQSVSAQSATPRASENTFPSREQLLEKARANPASDLEHRVLEDGVVTPEEYEEAVTAFLECMQEERFETEKIPDPYVPGAYLYETVYVADPSTPAAITGTPTWEVISSDGSTGMAAEDYRYHEAFSSCSIGTTFMIEAIYVLQVVNPNDINIMELTVACLVENKIIAPGELTGKQFEAEMQKEAPNLSFDLMNPRVINCLNNPAQNGINGNPLVLPSTDATPAP